MPVESTKGSNSIIMHQQTASFTSVAKSNGIADMRSSLCSKSAKKKESDGGCLKCIADFFKAIWNFLCCQGSKKKKASSEETEDSASSTEVSRTKSKKPPKTSSKETLYKNAETILTNALSKDLFEKMPQGRIKYTCIVTVDGKCLPDLDGIKQYVVRTDTGYLNRDNYLQTVSRTEREYLQLIKAGLETVKLKPDSTIKVQIILVGDLIEHLDSDGTTQQKVALVKSEASAQNGKILPKPDFVNIAMPGFHAMCEFSDWFPDADSSAAATPRGFLLNMLHSKPEGVDAKSA